MHSWVHDKLEPLRGRLVQNNIEMWKYIFTIYIFRKGDPKRALLYLNRACAFEELDPSSSAIPFILRSQCFAEMGRCVTDNNYNKDVAILNFRSYWWNKSPPVMPLSLIQFNIGVYMLAAISWRWLMQRSLLNSCQDRFGPCWQWETHFITLHYLNVPFSIIIGNLNPAWNIKWL